MSKLSRLYVCGLICATFLYAAPQAHADVPPPGFEECVGKAAGDVCELGVCRSQTCSRLDYEHWDRDSGMGPPTIQYACTLCVAEMSPDGDSGCGCAAAGRDLGQRSAAVSFALLMGLVLGVRRRRSAR